MLHSLLFVFTGKTEPTSVMQKKRKVIKEEPLSSDEDVADKVDVDFDDDDVHMPKASRKST